jgi:uncharacterized protein
MLVLDRLIGLASPETALRREVRLSDEGKVAEAFPLLTRSAKAGIADAEYRVACCYLEGAGVPASRIEGARWLQRAAGHGHVEAQTLLGGLCVHGLAGDLSGDRPERLFAEEGPGEPDFPSALKWARPAAEAGSAKAQAVLAYVLTCGPEEMRDLEGAHRWYQRSAAGCPEGCLGYALSLRAADAGRGRAARSRRAFAPGRRGRIADRDLSAGGLDRAGGRSGARPCGRGAALRPRGRARATLGATALGTGVDGGRDVEQDLVLGESWLRRAALAGDPDAAALVGDLYVKNGLLPPNYTEAAGWYRRAAEAGHIAAARALGSLYLTGAGVAADPDEAARWLRVSGEAGDPASQVDLANLVLDGAGSAEDRGKVAHWFEQAAASGDLVAAFNLGLCLDKGVGVEPDAQQAAHWLRRAAEGVPEAQYMYGRMLADGHGIPADPEAARGWISRASATGLREAQVALAEMMVNGRGGPRDTAAGLELFEKAAAGGHSGAMFALLEPRARRRRVQLAGGAFGEIAAEHQLGLAVAQLGGRAEPALRGHQRYSTENQSDAILQYAVRSGFDIVRTYADNGKSGLRLDGRDALKQLLIDVEGGSPGFKAVLVYDVSRWGRFQDADESAYYEYVCRRSGVEIRYCAEQFENDGSVASTIVKTVKRAMAGEYSRELSAKVIRRPVPTDRAGLPTGWPRRLRAAPSTPPSTASPNPS